ncbi:putative phage tail component, N-terminal domain-containing protein [Alkalithermobacter thermoalcaliphilus JW-YL-7 = DSM 7308]|uniref:Phage tail component, N-terminal domain-containing protein n=1 Tax=Alkalithermobacter thermoalcaliphilus JW-YL-7 = DSM 7308 TaxID=1121328 RepID=A0A150FS26_CLOPD|nr:tail component domain protein [[Clostridium] paradoxum JW-YL-7 = DSM 7308]SHL13883.1 putative phage tail component, N-terminal domain-containing protein [[Clostridium] paradoxum JW-YL-7 = DSM 7308]
MVGFVFNGVHSSYYNITARTDNRNLKPSLRVSEEIILGKDGSYKFENGYNDRVISVTCFLKHKDIYQRREIGRHVAKWLSGKGELKFDDEPNKFYKARIDKEIDLTIDVAIDIFTVDFVCEPFAYSEFKIANISGIGSIQNNGTQEVGFIAELNLSPRTTINVNGKSFTVTNIDQKTYVDTDKMICYTINNNKKTNKMLDFIGNFPKLSLGNNQVTVSGGETVIKYREMYL